MWLPPHGLLSLAAFLLKDARRGNLVAPFFRKNQLGSKSVETTPLSERGLNVL
jgi:hypothetical protein